jgi:hypothetical protein
MNKIISYIIFIPRKILKFLIGLFRVDKWLYPLFNLLFIIVALALIIGPIVFSTVPSIQTSYFGEFMEKLSGFREFEKGEIGFLDFKSNWFYGFYIGFSSGITLLIIYRIFIIREIRYIKGKYRETYQLEKFFSLKYYNFRWLRAISNRFYKPLIIGFIFATFHATPILNRATQIITLSFLNSNFYFKVIILALELGVFPSIIEYYYIKKTSTQFEQKGEFVRKRLKQLMGDEKLSK